MMLQLRVLPLTIVAAFLLLGLKVGEVMHDGKALILSYNDAEAQQAAPEKPADTKPADSKAMDAKPADAKAGDIKAGDAKAAESGTEKGPSVAPPSAAAGQDDDTPPPPKREFSQVEIDLLQSLAKRREELDNWAKQIQLKENMLIATEQRINDKIDTLKGMKKELEKLLAQYNEAEDTKIRSLVKIYENMKPKDAARIFEELDMPVLLMVVDRMSERKVAPILAGMNPTKAKDLTVQLAEQRKLQKPRAAGAGVADAAPETPPSDGGAPASGDTGAAAPSQPPPAASAPAAPQNGGGGR